MHPSVKTIRYAALLCYPVMVTPCIVQLFLLMCWDNTFVHIKQRQKNLSATLAFNMGRDGVELRVRQQGNCLDLVK